MGNTCLHADIDHHRKPYPLAKLFAYNSLEDGPETWYIVIDLYPWSY